MSGAAAFPLVHAVDVSRTFGTGQRAVVAVHDLTAAVAPGARIAVTGPSGSGKSTIVHLLAGLERPTTGTVSWPGLASEGLTLGHQIGLVFQGPSLLPPLTVAENAALPLVLQGIHEAAAEARALAALAALGLDGLAEKLPEEISGGQAQRVAVARVLAAAPRLILADEPTGRLDRVTAGHVIDVLVEAADRLGAALVVASHDLSVVQRLATRWIVRDGTLVTAGKMPRVAT